VGRLHTAASTRVNKGIGGAAFLLERLLAVLHMKNHRVIVAGSEPIHVEIPEVLDGSVQIH
jgi:hypothetical protein